MKQFIRALGFSDDLLSRLVQSSRRPAEGFASDLGLQLAVLRPRKETADADAVADALADAGLPHLILRQQDELVVLLHDDDRARAALTGPPPPRSG